MNNKYYPMLKKQDERLREICEKQLKLKYEEKSDVAERLEWELQSIKKTGTAFVFLIFIQLIKNIGTVFYSFVNDNEVNYSLVAYLCDITRIDPVRFNLAPCFCYGNDGEKKVNFNLSVPVSKIERVLECCKQLEGVSGVIEKHIEERIGKDHIINLINLWLVPGEEGASRNNSVLKPENYPNWSDKTVLDEHLYCIKIKIGKWENKVQKLVDLTGILPDFSEFCDSGAINALKYKLGEFIKSDLCENRRDMLKSIDTQNIRQMLKIYRIADGEAEWIDVCDLLVQYDIATLDEVVVFGDDLYEQLRQYGVPDRIAFEIADSFDIEEILYSETEGLVQEYGVPKWYIKLCENADLCSIFNRGNLCESILYDWISGWYKVHYPLEYCKVFHENGEE